MEKIVYILGAGFSAPAGLPLMSNFLSMSKDMFSEDPDTYKHFGSIFSKVDQLSKILVYYKANLRNIEEILSILEMQEKLGESPSMRRQFVRYIIDVINYYSPKKELFEDYERPSHNTHRYFFGKSEDLSLFGHFVLALTKANITSANGVNWESLVYRNDTKIQTEYSIVTFNYDTVIENYIDFVRDKMSPSPSLELPIHKIHGCVTKGNIVPPTWAKDIGKDMVSVWRGAFSSLVDATKIRIVGYSLPVSDSYFRYFLKSTIIKNSNLKSIDVICLDPSGLISQNYRDFFTFENLRFSNARTEDYLTEIQDSLPNGRGHGRLLMYTYEFFERNHDAFMNRTRPSN